MKEQINRENYEAFFLDFAEGNLSEEGQKELMLFLEANPDLKQELDEFESFVLKPEGNTSDWSSLKAPQLDELEKSEKLREQLYFKAVEGDLSQVEESVLADLLKSAERQAEFESWKKTKLIPTSESADRSDLYRLPLELPISTFNYEYFLIARTEGILNEEQSKALEVYAASLAKGSADLELADGMRLEAPLGIFYPDKSSLKKRAVPVWLFRAAAIILLFGVASVLWFMIGDSDPGEPQYAERVKQTESIDTTEDVDTTKAVTPDAVESAPEEEEERELEEWEIFEPDPVQVAQASPTPKQVDKPEENETRLELESLEKQPEAVLFASKDEPGLKTEVKPLDIELPETQTIATKEPQFLTIPELAEERLADELALSDEERDEVAMSLAKRITQKAGEALDAEVTKEEVEDESLTYTVRFRGLKISRTKAK